MKKILLSLSALLMAGGAWAQQYTLKTFDVTDDESQPKTYVMESMRGGYGCPEWWYDSADNKVKTQQGISYSETADNNHFLWYFTDAGDGKYYIHPYGAQSGYVLGAEEITNDAEVIAVQKNSTAAIKWTLATSGDPCFSIVSGEKTYYLHDYFDDSTKRSDKSVLKESSQASNAKGYTFRFGKFDPIVQTVKEELSALMNTLDYQMAYKCLGNLAGQFSDNNDAYKTAYEAAKEAIDNESGNYETLKSELETAFEALVYEPIANDKYYAFKNKQHDQYMYCSGKGQKLTVNDNYFVFKLTTVSENVSLQIYIDANGRCINGDFWANNVGYSTDTKFYQLSDAPGYYIILSNSQNIYEAATEGGTVTYLEDKSTAFTNEACHWTVEEVAPSISITDAQYATFYAPVAVTIPDNVSAYYVSATTTNSATLTELETTIPANTGVVLYSEAECESTPAIVNYVAPQEGNLLSGSLKTEQVTGPAYILAKVDDTVGFYAATLTDGKFQNNAGKAYLPKPSESGARFLTFDFGTETAIESIQGAESVNAVVYDLAGRRVQGAQKGLYIVNGKKVIK